VLGGKGWGWGGGVGVGGGGGLLFSQGVQQDACQHTPHASATRSPRPRPRQAGLTDNLLAANWSARRLPNVAILGNAFSTYLDRWRAAGGKPSGARPDRLLRLAEAGAVLEVPVPDGGFHVASAFNDSSLHIFPAAACGDIVFN